MKRRRTLIALCGGLLLAVSTQAFAQQLDTDYFPKPAKAPSRTHQAPANLMRAGASPPESVALPPVGSRKPLSISITKTLYLPPAMYGQWSIIGTLLSTNEEALSRITNTWIFAREGDDVIISNPSNGATAVINVKQVENNHATIQRQITTARNYPGEEILSLTVNGDTLTGQDTYKTFIVKNGQVRKELFTVYRIDATRIGGARTEFHPESTHNIPDLQIEEKL